MPEYRAYIFGPDGHVELSIDLKVATEREARKRANSSLTNALLSFGTALFE
jgi:hypothetical protein